MCRLVDERPSRQLTSDCSSIAATEPDTSGNYFRPNVHVMTVG